MEDVAQQRVEVELPGGEPLDESHWGATAGTRPRRTRGRGRRRFGCRSRRGGQRLTALREVRRAPPCGEEAEVADADEALREDVHQEATEKLDSATA